MTSEVRAMELVAAMQPLLQSIALIDPSHPRGVDGGNLDRVQELYARRNQSILVALGSAAMLGWECGVGIDPQEPDWPVVYIQLPTGQVSWHITSYDKPYDGHSTEEKYQRIADFCAMNVAEALVQ